jgi:hypothetical protein
LYNNLIELRVPTKLVCLCKRCSSETYNEVHVSVGKHLYDTVGIETDLKHGDVLSRQLFNFGVYTALGRSNETTWSTVVI